MNEVEHTSELEEAIKKSNAIEARLKDEYVFYEVVETEDGEIKKRKEKIRMNKSDYFLNRLIINGSGNVFLQFHNEAGTYMECELSVEEFEELFVRKNRLF